MTSNLFLFFMKNECLIAANSDRARDLWEKDLEVELSTEAWSNAFMSAKKIYTVHATDSGRVNIEYYTEYNVLLNFCTKLILSSPPSVLSVIKK